LSLNQAVCKDHKNWPSDILSGLENIISAVKSDDSAYSQDVVQACANRVTATFAKDCCRVADIADLLFGPDITTYGDRASAVFVQWEEEGAGPSMAAILAAAADYFQMETSAPEMRAALMAAILADVPNGLLYHNNEHYRKVVFHAVRLLATHRHGHFPYQPLLYNDDILKMLIAAMIHDLGHEGGDNMRGGIYTPGYMEQKACGLMRPYFEALEVDRDFRDEIETMVFCTDITPFAGENTPCVRMKKIYHHFFLGGLSGDDANSMMIGKLRLFQGNPRLALMAMMLHEADIATSAGLTYEQSKAETINFMEERGADAGPKVLLRFLAEQLNGRMITPPAQFLFAGRMESIMQQANDDMNAGIERY
jgi:hypothetical protein